MKDLPFTISVFGTPVQPITVRRRHEGDPKLGGPGQPLACFCPDTWEIVVREEEEGPALQNLLMHEFLHVVEHVLILQGYLKRGVTHDFITFGAPGLLVLLSEAGMLTLDRKDLLNWMQEEERE